MNLKKIFSPTTLGAFCTEAAKLHPFTLGWLCALTIYGILSINNVIEGTSVISFCFAEGFFMSLAIDIWTDFMNKRRFYVILEAIAAVLVVTDCVVMSFVGGFDSQANFLGHLSLMVALLVACFFVPPVGSEINNRTQTFSQLFNVIRCVGLTIILSIASSILLYLLYGLFQIDNGHFDFTVVFICDVILPAFLFIGLQRTLVDIIESKPITLGGTISKFVFLPISIIYFIVLYVYLIKILLTWQLPDGGVTWMVSVQLLIVLITLYGLRDYSLDSDAGKANVYISRLAMRWLPLLVFPLLVLMTVGLVYRFNEYGVTASRIYVAVFLIWAYGVDVYLIIKRQKANLNLIAISFAVLFVAVSVIPGCNITNISNSIIRAQIKEAFTGVQLPMTLDQAQDALAKMPEKKAENIASKIVYLDSYYDHSLINDIVNSDNKIWASDLIRQSKIADVTDKLAETTYSRHTFEVPEGFSQFKEHQNLDLDDYNIDNNELLSAIQNEEQPQINIWGKDSTRVALVTYMAVSLPTDSTEFAIRSINATVFFNK